MRRLQLYRTSHRFPSISVTGTMCALRCLHCQGRYLRGMRAVDSPEALEKMLKEEELIGFLLSGGSDVEGHVPVRPYAPVISSAVARGIEVVVHLGVPDPGDTSVWAETGAIVALDVPASDAVVRDLMRLPIGREIYLRGLIELTDAGVTAVPHITVGMPQATVEDECVLVDLLARAGVADLVVNGFIATRGTALSGAPDAGVGRVAEVVRRATLRGMTVRVGCMRPRGPEMELRAVDAGAVAMVNISRRARGLLEATGGYILEDREGCCVTDVRARARPARPLEPPRR